MDNILYILGSVGAVSLISFAGVLTLSFREERLARIVFMFVAVATGALLGDAFLHLIPEAYEKIKNPETISLLIILGMLVFFVLEKVLRWHHHHDDMSHESDREDPKYLGRLILISDGLHNLIDGVVIAVSYFISVEIGLATTLAVILHEIPQEIGDFAVLLHAGYTKMRALWLNFLSALLSIAGVLAVFILDKEQSFTAWILPIAAGGFIYVATSDLFPELKKDNDRLSQALMQLGSIIIGIGIMLILKIIIIYYKKE